MTTDDNSKSMFDDFISKLPDQSEEPLVVPTLSIDFDNTQSTDDSPDRNSSPLITQSSFFEVASVVDTIEADTIQKGEESLPIESTTTSPQCPALEVLLSQQLIETEKIGSLMQDVTTEVAGLKTTLQREISDQNIQRSSFEKLHREMLAYKENFLQKAMEPMFRQLIGCADHFEEIINQETITKSDLSFLYDELLNTLDCYEVEQFTSEGETFDASTQRIIKTEPIGDEALNRTIMRRMKPGYRLSGRVIRSEEVVVYKYDPALQTIIIDSNANKQIILEVKIDE